MLTPRSRGVASQQGRLPCHSDRDRRRVREIPEPEPRSARTMGRIPCCEKDSVKRGQWTPEEDNKLLSYITQYGTRNWRLIPKNAGTCPS